ncbi:hypothetical protein JW868_01170 [Candidatus Woesearchaeota archaeon]|nr:hypothetical protein [Candidatus Woesearchaeota archaeon]
MPNKELRKAFLIGMGVTLLTKDRIEKELKKLTKEYNLNTAEAKQVASQIVKDTKKHAAVVQKHIKAAEKKVHAVAKKAATETKKRTGKKKPTRKKKPVKKRKVPARKVKVRTTSVRRKKAKK